MVAISLIPIRSQIAAKEQELSDLLVYPADRLASIIGKVGFRCDRCSRCCTRAFNGHVFLLDCDAVRAKKIDPASVEPAPLPEFCDQNGTFYVSGYALRARNDGSGSCWFLEEGRCRIYDRRFSICRVYPYMLHREPDARGRVDWRQIAGLDEHGEYHIGIPAEECRRIAELTVDFETACLRQDIAFLRFIEGYFARNRLRHVRKVYDDGMRLLARGREIRIMVYCYEGLHEHWIRRDG